MKLELGEPMDIYFCDLCNESFPEADLREGRAVRRKERVICATCESAMSAQGLDLEQRLGPERGLGPGRSLAADLGAGGTIAAVLGAVPAGGGISELPAHAEPLVSPPHAAPAPRSGSGLGMALLALLFSIAAAAYFAGELGDLRRQGSVERERLEQELSNVRADASQARTSLEQVTGRLDLGLRQLVEDARRELRVDLAAQRHEIEGTRERLDAFEGGLGKLREVADERGAAGDLRIDELFAQLAKGRQDVGFFSERLAALEKVVQGAALPSAAQEPLQPPPAPAWNAALADLASDNPGTRWNAVQALGESGDPAVVPHLVPMLADGDVFVRMAVARVLGDLAAPEAIEPLIDALEDEDAAVREMAMVSLRTITGRDFKFDAVASPAERAKKVKAWRQWWKKAQEEYFPGSTQGDPAEGGGSTEGGRAE